MSDESVRVEIGFDSGLIVIAMVTGGEWKKLEAALQKGSGMASFDGDDGSSYFVDASKVNYVKHESRVGRVGF